MIAMRPASNPLPPIALASFLLRTSMYNMNVSERTNKYDQQRPTTELILDTVSLSCTRNHCVREIVAFAVDLRFTRRFRSTLLSLGIRAPRLLSSPRWSCSLSHAAQRHTSAALAVPQVVRCEQARHSTSTWPPANLLRNGEREKK